MFALDWTYGRVLAIHTTPRGASYRGSAETFLRGRPLNVTDVDFGPDGAMYLITGGRKTQSALYRIEYVGPPVDESPRTEQQRARIAYSRQARKLRKRLEELHGLTSEGAVEIAWPLLDHPDPAIRHAARIAVEHQPVDRWQERALQEERITASLTSLMSLAAEADSKTLGRIIARLNEIPLKDLAESNKWTALRTYQICLDRGVRLGNGIQDAVISKIDSVYPDPSPAVNLLSSKLLARLNSPSVVSKTLALLDETDEQAAKLHYLFILGNVKNDWTNELRQNYLRQLRGMRDFRGGEGMPGFIARITAQAMSVLKGDELAKAVSFLKQDTSLEEPVVASDRKLVRRWTTDELLAAIRQDSGQVDFERGSTMFAVAQCVLCHRMGNRGSAIGPDLTSVAARFSTRDLLESTIDPSKVVAEQYQSDVITTIHGKVINGRIVPSGDYRSPTLRIATDPLDPAKTIAIIKSEIESHTRSPISRMPEGLLDTLRQEEILDLIAYIRSGGNGQ